MKKSTIFWLICFGLTIVTSTIKGVIPIFIKYEELRFCVYTLLGIAALIYIRFCIINCIINEYNAKPYMLDVDKKFQKGNFIHQINTLIDKTIPSLINKNKKQ